MKDTGRSGHLKLRETAGKRQEFKSLNVTLICHFQTAASVLTHRLPHSAKPLSRILPQRGIIMNKHIQVPFSKETARKLKAGDMVYLSGTIYTARDAAHKRMEEALTAGENLPFDLRGNIIYYMGPSPARGGAVIGSAGPTTASRMDKYTPKLLDLGMAGMIGKGKRSEAVQNAIVRNEAVYFAAIGGAGALLSKHIVSSEVIAYEDLGTEAVRKLEVKEFPVIVVIDTEGKNLYQQVAEGTTSSD